MKNMINLSSKMRRKWFPILKVRTNGCPITIRIIIYFCLLFLHGLVHEEQGDYTDGRQDDNEGRYCAYKHLHAFPTKNNNIRPFKNAKFITSIVTYVLKSRPPTFLSIVTNPFFYEAKNSMKDLFLFILSRPKKRTTESVQKW